MEKIEIFAQDEDCGKRLDKFLFEKMFESNPAISRVRVKMLVDEGDVVGVDDGEVFKKCSYKIKGGEKFIIDIPELRESEMVAKDVDFGIVFEDEHMLVVNKPAGLITHPGNGNHDSTLANGLLFKLGTSLSGINGVMRPGIVHRLDKDTSGLMVVAKNDLAHKSLAEQIQSRELKRNYLAMCYGMPKPLKGRIENNIERSRKNRLKMIVVKTGGKSAITNYEVKEVYYDGALSLIECKLDTGRTHQIRVHMNEIGHSLIGDQTYKDRRVGLNGLSDEVRDLALGFGRQFLHSYKIAFSHPVSGEFMEFEAPLSDDLEEFKGIIAGSRS